MKLGFPRILVTRFEVGFMQHLALRQISRIPTCLVQTTLFVEVRTTRIVVQYP